MPTIQNNSYFKVAYFRVAGPIQDFDATSSLFGDSATASHLTCLEPEFLLQPLSSPTNAALQRAESGGGVLTLDPIGPLPRKDRSLMEFPGSQRRSLILFLSFHFLLSTSYI